MESVYVAEKQAEQAFRTAIELDPHHADALSALGWLLYNGRRLEQARVIYDRALTVEPASPLLLVSAGMLSEEIGDYSCGLALFERAVEIAPGLMNAHFAIGSYHWRYSGDLAEASRRLERAVKLDPNGSIPPAMLAMLSLDGGDLAAAERWSKTASAMAYDAYWPALARLALAVRSGDAETATAAAKVLSSYSAEPLALRYLRDQALQSGSPEAAVQVYPEWLRSDDVLVSHSNVRLIADLAYAYRAAGKTDLAEQLALGVLDVTQRWPRRSWQGYWLADVAAEMVLEKPEAALQRLRDAMNDGWHVFWWWELEHNAALRDLRAMPGYAEVIGMLPPDTTDPVIDEVGERTSLQFCDALNRL